MLSSGIHWYSFSSSWGRRHLLQALAEAMGRTGDPYAHFTKVDGAFLGYAKTYVGPLGVRLACSDGLDRCHVIIPGQACEAISMQDMRRLMNLPLSKACRIDIAIDGLTRLGKPLDPRFIYRMALNDPGKINCAAKLATPDIENVRLIEGKLGRTCYLGTPSSQRMIRFYDMRGFCRMELQVQDDKAELLREILAGSTLDDMPEKFIGAIRGFIDFLKTSRATNKQRAALAGWWSVIVENIDDIELRLSRPDVSIERTMRWLLLGGGAAALDALLEIAGGDQCFLDELLRRGRAKRNTTRFHHLATSAGGIGDWDWKRTMEQATHEDHPEPERVNIADFMAGIPDTGSDTAAELFGGGTC